jgi:hypothetical protein
VTGLLARLRNPRAHRAALEAAAQADAAAWLAPLLATPTPALATPARAGAHPYQPTSPKDQP